MGVRKRQKERVRKGERDEVSRIKLVSRRERKERKGERETNGQFELGGWGIKRESKYRGGGGGLEGDKRNRETKARKEREGKKREREKKRYDVMRIKCVSGRDKRERERCR